MQKKVAIILSGCGHLDGSEIHETVLSYLALEEKGFLYDSFAPDRDTSIVRSHKGKEDQPTRNILAESARIARGKIRPLKELKASDYDLLWLPGGFGVALQLSDFAEKGELLTIDPDVAKVITIFHEQKKPIVAICIAPVLLARLIPGAKLTLGQDPKERELLQRMGAKGVSCKVDEMCFDEKHNLYTAPGYMEPSHMVGIYRSLVQIVNALQEKR